MELSTRRRRRPSSRGLLESIRSLYQRAVLRRVFHVAGLIQLRRGKLESAEVCFSRAVLLDPGSFTARIQLGRVYFLMEEFFKAEQQFMKAQEIDPKRFQRHHLPDDYAAWEEVDSGEDRGDRVFGDYEAEGLLYSFEEDDESEPFRYGDFSSLEEWKRFQAMPPISPTEIRNVDWDRIFSTDRDGRS